MDLYRQSFSLAYQYPVFFAEGVFEPDAGIFGGMMAECNIRKGSRFLFCVDRNVAASHPSLLKNIVNTLALSGMNLAGDILVLPGGEEAKQDLSVVQKVLEAIHEYRIDRHSYLACAGGGALLDAVGLAAAIGHRGVRLIRIPTTVLSQNDSGVGVKNGINYFGKKNFIGTFSPPFAVINDGSFLVTLSDRDFRCGIAEAIKVGLVKDADFFSFLEKNADELVRRGRKVTMEMVRRCAEIHLRHISSGDPFEKGSSRPLDYGHWGAHKLEQMSGYSILHGEAVIMGMCLDAVYARLKGMLSATELERLVLLCKRLGFAVYSAEMERTGSGGGNAMTEGLEEFREHLGGRLTIMLLEKTGKGIEVHEMDREMILESIRTLRSLQ